MIYEMKFEIDEPQFTQREMLGVIDLPATTLNTWIKRNQLDPIEFERLFGTDGDAFESASGMNDHRDKRRKFKVFQHDPAVRRIRLYSILDCLCLAGIKAVLDTNIEIRFAYQFPDLLCHWWTNEQLWNLDRSSISEEPIILYVEDGQLMSLVPPTPIRRLTADVSDPKAKRALEANSLALVGRNPHRLSWADLAGAMRDAQLTSVTVIDWPSIEERVINGLKKIIGVRGRRRWEKEEG